MNKLSEKFRTTPSTGRTHHVENTDCRFPAAVSDFDVLVPLIMVWRLSSSIDLLLKKENHVEEIEIRGSISVFGVQFWTEIADSRRRTVQWQIGGLMGRLNSRWTDDGTLHPRWSSDQRLGS